jgi:primase-polymerase (primpol)-like protein
MVKACCMMISSLRRPYALQDPRRYVEASPSGKGVHIIVEGTVRDGGRSRKKVHLNGEVVGEIEMYSRGRFFTITGEVL